MDQQFEPGDFLIFQLESGYGLLRVLDVAERAGGDLVWHVAAYEDLFLDVEGVELALEHPDSLTVSHPHVALTSRAFASTQVAKMLNIALSEHDLISYRQWQTRPDSEVHDRSVRLMLGLR